MPWRDENATFYEIALHPVFFTIHFDFSIRVFDGLHTIDHTLRLRIGPVALRTLFVGRTGTLPRLLARDFFWRAGFQVQA
ncbi:hypothetical protein D3C86_1999900 [compost metagenome]